ncbi:MAG TPA: flagellar protein [Bradyrhizobium sp.]|nr:flagellar protein [Bradyrhizobium sp.]
MSISSINYGSSVLGQSVQNINQQLTNLSTELSSGVKSTNYAGMGPDEGFAIAARAQLANIGAYTDTMTNVTTIINAANAALQSLSSTVSEVQNAASATPQNMTSTGQTIGQQNAAAQLSSVLGMLNTQVGDRYIFSGTAIDTPAVATSDAILNGSGTQAGLKQVIAERLQADQGSASPSTGRLVLTQPTATSVQVAEDVAGSPFGIKLASVSSSLTNAVVTGPTGASPAAIKVDMTAGNPNSGDQITYNFNLPDGTTQSVTLTATSTTPPPSGSFAIGATTAATASNLDTALTTAINNIANTSLVAASAVAAGNNFFNATTVVGNPASQVSPAAPITGNTALSGAANSLSTGFNAGDSITVNGQTITFVASGASGNNQVNVTDNVQTLLTKIDALTGTSTPSTVTNGIVTINGNSGSPSLTVSSSNAAAFAALGLPASGTATAGPLRVSGASLATATSLTSGAANTVEWYTGNSGPGTARSTSTVRVDNSQTVQFGAQANEQAIRNALQQIAVYAAVVANPPGGSNAGAQASALSQRINNNLTPQPGQQAISDIQTDFATAQNTMKDVQARQTQSQTALQNLISNTEGISQNQVASEILALQTSLQASYQTTAMLSQLSLVKFLPVA